MKTTIGDYVKQNSLPILLQALSLAGLIITLYITTRLAPIAESVSNLNLKVTAIENDYARKSYVDTGFQHVKEGLERVELKIDRLEGKIDRL